MVHLVVILIWRFGGFSSDRQIKITANTVVLSQILINSNNERAYLPNQISVNLFSFPNLMFAKGTTHMVATSLYFMHKHIAS